MPHIAIDYSSNVTDLVEIEGLVQRVHEAAMAAGIFELGSVRTFARQAVAARVGDGAVCNRFVRIDARIAPGRSSDVRQAALVAFFKAAERHLQSAIDLGAIALQVEMTKFDRSNVLSRNTMIADRRA